MTESAGPWLSFKAAFFPNRSVAHVAGVRGELAAFFPQSEIVEIRLSRPALDGLLRYVDQAFARDGRAAAEALGPGHYGNSRFYPGRETFHLLRTCNVETARALRAAGLPVRNAITLDGFMSQVRPLRAR